MRKGWAGQKRVAPELVRDPDEGLTGALSVDAESRQRARLEVAPCEREGAKRRSKRGAIGGTKPR